MTAYEKVMAARDAKKLTAVDYIAHMFGDSFIELHGDRRYSDDKAIVAGIAMLQRVLQEVHCRKLKRRKSNFFFMVCHGKSVRLP